VSEHGSSHSSFLGAVPRSGRGADGHLNLRTRAEEARWQDGAWQLSGITELAVQGAAAETDRTERRWESNLRPDDVVRLDADEPHLSSVELAAVIDGERVGTRPRSFYETVLMQSFAAPFTVFIMMLLATPAALASDRGGGAGRMLIALALGLGFLLVDGVFSAYGTSGRISPLVAAFTAPLIFAMVGLAQLRSAERA
jgi:lipopolysaccharide export system permease protein